VSKDANFGHYASVPLLGGAYNAPRIWVLTHLKKQKANQTYLTEHPAVANR
jgi:hypothetical protein